MEMNKFDCVIKTKMRISVGVGKGAEETIRCLMSKNIFRKPFKAEN